jgi:hypothetical protein
MARLLFPADQTALIYTEPGAAVLAPTQHSITVYADSTLSELANITTTDGFTITNSVVLIGTDFKIPFFLGPDDPDVTVLYGKGTQGPAFPMYANYSARLAHLEMFGGIPVFVGENPASNDETYIWFHEVDGQWIYTVVENNVVTAIYPASSIFPGPDIYPGE